MKTLIYNNEVKISQIKRFVEPFHDQISQSAVRNWLTIGTEEVTKNRF